MSYYHTCPQCGANLDPGERCDCAKPQRYHLTVLLDDGDTIATGWSGSPLEAVQHYPVGQYINVGRGPHDHYARVVGLDIKAQTA